MADNESKNNYWVLELSRYDKIEEVYIAYTQMGVQGIAFRYVDATGTKQFKNFGLMHFNFAMKLKPNEYITKLSSIIVTEPQKAIALLRIHTNLLPAGKSGRDDLLNQKEKEHPKWLEKSIPVQTYEDIIVRIYGSPRSNELKKGETFLLTNIGVIVQKLKFKETKHLEIMWDENVMPPQLSSNFIPPQLSSKHQKWSFEFDRYEYIKEISVDHNDTEVIGIGFMKVDAFGAPTPIQWFGGKGEKSENTYKITLKPNENIVQMSGTWSYNNENEIVITSLKIHTNVWRSGYKLYGNNSPPNENSKYFSILVPTSGVISEIHGTYNNTNMHISSIGIGVKEPEYKREDYLMGVDTIKEEKHDEGDDAKKEESHEGGDAKKEEQREGDYAKNEERREGDNAKKEEPHEGDHAKEEHHEGDGAKKEEEHHE